MENCIFCKVIRGELPSYKVYEDDMFIGILDIFPVSRGHTLIIPKKHYQWTYEVPEFGRYFEVAKKVGLAIQKALGASWLQLLTHGQIPHAHIHITPRYDNVQAGPIVPKWDEPKKLSKEEFAQIAETIRKGF